MGLFTGNKDEIKKVTINLDLKKDVKKLQKLLEEGWEILSEHKRGALQWKHGQIDYVLIKRKK